MLELRYQTLQVTIYVKIDATMLWGLIQVFVLVGQHLNNLLR